MGVVEGAMLHALPQVTLQPCGCWCRSTGDGHLGGLWVSMVRGLGTGLCRWPLRLTSLCSGVSAPFGQATCISDFLLLPKWDLLWKILASNVSSFMSLGRTWVSAEPLPVSVW